MTVGNVLVNDTVRIKVRFVDIDSSTGEQVDVSPTLVAVRVYDSDNVQIVNTTATSLTASQYYYDYTPSEAGEYRVTFIGTMPDTTYITVNQQLYVSTPTDEYKPVITLFMKK